MSTSTSQNAAQSPDPLPANNSSPPSPPSSDSSSLTPPSPPSSDSSSSTPPISSPIIPPPPPPPPLIESPPVNAPSPKSFTSPSSPPSDSIDDGKGSSFPLPPPARNRSPSSRKPSLPSSQQLSPPSPKNSEKEQSAQSPSTSNGGGSPSSHFNLPLIAAIAGGILALVIILVIVSFVCNKKKKRKPHNPMQYYADPTGRKGNGYYIGGNPQKWGNQDHRAASPQVPHIPPNGGWHARPPPMMNTDDMSTFSGPHAPPLPPPSPTIALGFNKSTFTYEELAAATNGFIQANLLGQGGFGYVHKGVLPNGKEIAVKSLKSGSGQGEREFQAEVDIISRVHHRHLVSLVGYCISGTRRMLVYDFVPNKTLEYHLHGKGIPTMDWPTRLKIALGSAKGLAYLHEDCHPRIIHRDIKSANILLDFKFEALVADFGLAKLSSDNHTHISTRVMGTFGYLAPEYASSGKLTEKSDVFSYGVMLLELITGRRPCDSSHTFMEDSLVDWARPLLSHALSDGNYDELVDPNLEGNYDPMEMARMVACAAAAVRHSARRRPKMSQIVRALDGDVSLEDLNEGMRPGQSMLFSSGSDYDSDIYQSNMRRTMRKVPMASPEYSGEYSPVDFGHNRAGSSSSDGMFSDELNPIGNQRLRAHSPI